MDSPAIDTAPYGLHEHGLQGGKSLGILTIILKKDSGIKPGTVQEVPVEELVLDGVDVVGNPKGFRA